MSALRSKVKELSAHFSLQQLKRAMGYQGLHPSTRPAKRRRVEAPESAGGTENVAVGVHGGLSAGTSGSGSSGSSSSASAGTATELQAANSDARRWKDRADSMWRCVCCSGSLSC